MNIASIVTFARDSGGALCWRILRILVCGLTVFGLAAICFHFRSNRSTCSMLLLLAVLGIATLGDSVLALLASAAAILSFSWYFIDRVHSLSIDTVEGAVTFGTMAVTAITASQLSIRAQRRAAEAMRRREELARLNTLGTRLVGANTVDEAAGQVVEGLYEVFGLNGVRLRLEESSCPYAAGSLDRAPVFTIPVPEAKGALEISGPQLSEEVRNVLSNMIGQVIERARNSQEKSRLVAEQKGEELRSTVLNALAHSFRTPLTSIKIAASMLRTDDTVTVSDQKDLIAAIDEEASRLDQLIGESLDLARIEGRRANPRREVCSVYGIIDRVTARMTRHFGRREVVVEVPDDLPPLVGDPFLLEQMLIQVVDNAWKYSRPGSRIRISAEASGPSVMLSVRNQGSEILPGEQVRIFDKFYRGSQYQSAVEGTGLGLAIAKTIAEACQGRIWLESEPAGPAFHFALPFGAGAEVGAEAKG